MKRNLSKKFLVMAGVGLLSMTTIAGCGIDTLKETFNKQEDDCEKDDKDDYEEDYEDEYEEDYDSEDSDEAEDTIKYPKGIKKGPFMATEYESKNEFTNVVEKVYYDEQGIIRRKDLMGESDTIPEIKIIFKYDDNGNLVSFEKYYENTGRLSQAGTVEDSKVTLVSYDSDGSESIRELYLDKYGIVTKESITKEGKVEDNERSFNYEFYDNGSLKSVSITQEDKEFYDHNAKKIYSDQFMYIVECATSNRTRSAVGSIEFDEDGNKIREEIGDTVKTWKYDDNGWVMESEEVETREDEIDTTNSTWEYEQIDTDSSIYDEVFAE